MPKLKSKPKVYGALAGTNPNTELAKLETVVTNLTDKNLTLSFLGVHGLVLDAGDSYTMDGDIRTRLLTGGGRLHKRHLKALDDLITAKVLRVHTSHRHIRYCAVDAAQTIAVGDFVWLNTDDVRAASELAWNGNLATTQADFANVFLGIALDAHVPADGAVTNFRVDISPNSLRSYSCTSATYELGATLGPAKNATQNKLQNQKLEAAAASSSIARAASRLASAGTTVVAAFQPAYWGHNAAGAQ